MFVVLSAFFVLNGWNITKSDLHIPYLYAYYASPYAHVYRALAYTQYFNIEMGVCTPGLLCYGEKGVDVLAFRDFATDELNAYGVPVIVLGSHICFARVSSLIVLSYKSRKM
eukprot:Pgem_evm1s12929